MKEETPEVNASTLGNIDKCRDGNNALQTLFEAYNAKVAGGATKVRIHCFPFHRQQLTFAAQN